MFGTRVLSGPMVRALVVGGAALGLAIGGVTAAGAALAAASPTVTNVAPNAGPLSGGTQVEVTGTGFTAVTGVMFGSVRASSFTVQGSGTVGSLIAIAPKHLAGRTDLHAITGHGTSPADGSATRYTYIAPPRSLTVGTPKTIDGFDPLIPLDAVACPTSSVCTFFDTYGLASSYLDGTWVSPDQVDGHDNPIRFESCASASFCMATDENGNTYRWNGGGWGDAAPIADSAPPADQWPLSCISPTFCMAVDQYGHASIYNGTSWSTPSLVTPDNSLPVLESVSCVSTTWCEAAGDSDFDGRGGQQYGAVIAYRDGTWGAPQIFPSRERVAAISCPSVHFCAVGDSNGIRVWTGNTTQVGEGDQGWSPDIRLHGDTGSGTLTTALDCTNATFCLAYWQDSNTGIKHWARIDGASVADQVIPVQHAGSFPTAVSCWARYACQFVGGTDTYRSS